MNTKTASRPILRKIKAFCAVLRRILEDHKFSSTNFATPNPTPKELAAQHPKESLALIVAALYHFHPSVYRVLEAHGASFYDTLYDWCGRDNPDRIHPCLVGLDYPYRISAPSAPGLGMLPELKSLYVDYSRGNVFRIQRLLLEAGHFTDSDIQSMLLK
ncbi:MAG: hypothetical protein QM770_16945 [Tepidisphaeraceae bacterium]